MSCGNLAALGLSLAGWPDRVPIGFRTWPHRLMCDDKTMIRQSFDVVESLIID